MCELKIKLFLHEFDNVVKKYPDAVALSTLSEKISYKELKERIIRVSSKLKEKRVGKGDIVALWMEKSPKYIESFLAVWYLGGVTVPLDATTPKARIDWILEDAKVKILITDNEIISPIQSVSNKILNSSPDSELTNNKIITLIEDTNGINIQADDNAYIIYTSGSTGKPKGVVVSHEGIVNFLEKQIEVFQVNSKSKILQYLSIGFDASLSEIGITLLSGAELRIEKENEISSIEFLLTILERERITHICLPPSLLPILPIEKMPNSIETIIIGGEVCPVETVKTWASKFRIVNVYGPTEATVCSSLIVCTPNWDKPLIGYPIPNRDFHVLDENLLPIEDGESGELYLSGIGLAKEYANEKKLSQEKFIFKNGIRLYKTGDRVLKHSPNEIEFLGRMDRQFKLRGNLIEPAEIERVLSAYSNVKSVHVRKVKIHRETLVAYLFLNTKFPNYTQITLRIKEYLSSKLPRWMIPERFVFLDKFPLNINGKVDYNLLPKPELERPNYLPEFIEAKTEKEKRLCRILEKLICIEPVGVTDDFFMLGGDSLSMITLLAELSIIGITLSPEKFIQNPTVMGILSKDRDGKLICSDIEFLNKEAELEDNYFEEKEYLKLPEKKFSKILLTGATGFLGSRILYELSQVENIEIYCIIRNLDTQDPRKKLEKNYKEQGIEIKNWDKIIFLDGDITQPEFGLSKLHWNFLLNKIDTVFHFAANVNLIDSYELLKTTNVNAVREVLRFCNTEVKKDLHYASTLSVFVSSDDSRKIFYESDNLTTMKEVYGGYAQSKWVGEKILLNAIEHGMDSIFIYRFGLITGNSVSGYTKSGDFFSRFLKSICELKALPQDNIENLIVDITPVDYAAKVCMSIAISKNKSNRNVFHIANPNPLKLSELVSTLKEIGIVVFDCTKKEFLEKIQSLEMEDMHLYLSRVFLKEKEFTFIRPLDLFQATGVRFDFTNTNQICDEINYSKYLKKETLIKKYLEYLKISSK